MSTTRSVAGWLAALFATGAVGLGGCETQGPFEEAGEELDETVEEVEDEVDEEL